jgi:uncharacterized membrane protein
MIVHFPIALLSTGLIFRLIALRSVQKNSSSFMLPASFWLLGLGVLSAWCAVFAGKIAADIVAPTLENIETLVEHANHAFKTALFFSTAFLLDLFRAYLLKKYHLDAWIFKKGLLYFCLALYLFGFANLLITGRLGAQLVYEEGAAVQTVKHG